MSDTITAPAPREEAPDRASRLERDVVVRRGGAVARRGGHRLLLLEVGLVDRHVGARREPAAALGVVAPAEELDRVGDDVDRLALVARLALLPLPPLEPAVDRDGAALGEEARAVLALRAPDRDV